MVTRCVAKANEQATTESVAQASSIAGCVYVPIVADGLRAPQLVVLVERLGEGFVLDLAELLAVLLRKHLRDILRTEPKRETSARWLMDQTMTDTIMPPTHV